MKKLTTLLLMLSAALTLCVSAAAKDVETVQIVDTLWFTPPETCEAGTAANESTIVATIVQGLRDQNEAIALSNSYGLTSNDARYYYEVALSQATDVYWINSSPTIYTYSSGKIEIHPDYMTSAQQTTYKARLDEITAGVDECWSDFEKALYLNDYLVTHSKYDYATATGSSTTGFTTYELLVNGKGVCQAYTMAYRTLLNAVGVKNSTARSEAMNHIWTLVQLDGEWYHIDTTWNDPTNSTMKTDPSAPDRIGSARHGYFLLSDTAIQSTNSTQGRSSTHYDWVAAPTDTTCDSTTYDSWHGHAVTSAFVPLDGDWYYIGSNGIYQTADPETLAGSSVCSFTDRWRVWGSSSSYWSGNYSSLWRWGDKLLYNTPTALRSYDPATGKVSTAHTPDTSEGYLYGFTLVGNQATCLRMKDPSAFTDWALIDVTLSPYEAADYGDYSTYRSNGMLYLRQDADSGLLVLARYSADGRMVSVQVADRKNGELSAKLPESGWLKIFALDAQGAPRCAAALVLPKAT